jgi:hypothetical protein
MDDILTGLVVLVVAGLEVAGCSVRLFVAVSHGKIGCYNRFTSVC